MINTKTIHHHHHHHKTAPSTPLELNILKVHDTSVKLRWLEPRHPNGVLQGYSVHLHEPASDSNETRVLSEPQPVMEHTIQGLKPFTVYKAYVSAFTRKFTGDASLPIKFKTDVSAPSAPFVVNLSCAFPDAIQLQWQRPSTFNNAIDYYFVYYKKRSDYSYEERQIAAQTDKQLNEILITSLTADELYEFKVIAATRSIYDSNHLVRSESSDLTRVVLQPNCEGK